MPANRIVVRGGAGYIGSYTGQAWARAGYEPVLYKDLNNGFEAMNLGRGVGTSVVAVIEAVGKPCGRPPVNAVGPRRAGDPPMLVADPSRARARLNWRPEFDDLQTIIDTAVAWRRDRRFGLPSLLPTAA